MKQKHYPLLALLLLLQYPLWVGNGSIVTVWRLEHQIEVQQADNQHLTERNLALQADVVNLKSGMDSVEARARQDLGMIRKGERFYQVIEPGAR